MAGLDRRVDQERDDQRREQHDEQRRQQSSRAARVELGRSTSPVVERLARQQSGDEKTGKDEEDVDADEAARQPRHAGVERHDEQNRDAAKAFDVWSKPERSESMAAGRLDGQIPYGSTTVEVTPQRHPQRSEGPLCCRGEPETIYCPSLVVPPPEAPVRTAVRSVCCLA